MDLSNSGSITVFVDETYQVAEKGRLNTFYFLAAVFLNASDLSFYRQQVLAIAQTDSWHSHEALKSPGGRIRFEQLNSWIAENARGIIFSKVPLLPGDRLGEGTRAALIRKMIGELIENHGEGNLRIVYEKRLDGVQANADTRTLNGLRQMGIVGPSLEIRARTKVQEPLLWLADVLATGYRREYLFGDSPYWNELGNSVRISHH